MTIASPLPRNPLLLVTIFSIPYLIFSLILFLLFLIYGGHHRAHLFHNPHCRHSHPSLPTHLHRPILLLQISDLHISHFKPSSKSTLLHFESETLPSFIPHASALIITGDLVDAVTPRRYPLGDRSKQRSDEWHFINSIFARINVSIPCFATHGNHDSLGAFPAASPFHDLTCPSLESSLRKTELHGVTLLALDCTLPHPLHRPLNFFGDASVARNLTSALEAIPSPILAFAHYPTAIMEGGAGIHAANVASGSKVVAFLSGHLHTLKGFAPRGLQAVTDDGTFELELPDMVEARTYRVIVFDQGLLSFRDFRVGEKRALIVTNPPRAGFCARGAGEVAASSSHIRMIVVGGGLEGAGVYVDGAYIGRAEILESCDGDSSKCVPVYGVAWNARAYDDEQLHRLVVRHAQESTFEEHVFSLNGLPEEGLLGRWRALISSVFLLSEFDLMASWLCHTGLVLCMLLCAPGLRGLRSSSVVLFVAAIVLKYGPAFIVGRRLSDMDESIGMVGLRYMRLPSGKFLSGVDVPYIMSVTVLYGSLLPVCYVDALSSTRVVSNTTGLMVAHLFGALYLLKSFWWCWEIFGAHGVLAGLLSPSCTPLFVVLVFTTTNSLKRISKWQR